SPSEDLSAAIAPGGCAPCLGRVLVVDVRGGEDRLRRGCGDGPIEPLPDFPLAGGMVSVWNRLHSKSPWEFGHGICVGRSNVPQTPGDFEFSPAYHATPTWDHAWLRLNLSIRWISVIDGGGVVGYSVV